MKNKNKPKTFREAVDRYQGEMEKRPGDEGDIFDCDTCGEDTDEVYEHESTPGEFNCHDCHTKKYGDED